MPCDPFEMAMVHRGFRRELHGTGGLVRGVAAGDRRRAAVIGKHINFILTAVHFHHSAEDAFIWPRLSARAPGCTVELTRMADAHRAIDDGCEHARAAVAPWITSGDPGHADELLPVIEGLTGRIDEHFDDEERHVVPVIAEQLSSKEWSKFLAHGSAFVRMHPRRGLALGGMVLDGESADLRERFLGNLPLPLRTVFKMIGGRVYAGYRAQLE